MSVRSRVSKMTRAMGIALIASVIGLSVAGCGSDDGNTSEVGSDSIPEQPSEESSASTSEGNLLEVPSTYPMIQEAVDAATPGQRVLRV